MLTLSLKYLSLPCIATCMICKPLRRILGLSLRLTPHAKRPLLLCQFLTSSTCETINSFRPFLSQLVQLTLWSVHMVPSSGWNLMARGQRDSDSFYEFTPNWIKTSVHLINYIYFFLEKPRGTQPSCHALAYKMNDAPQDCCLSQPCRTPSLLLKTFSKRFRGE